MQLIFGMLIMNGLFMALRVETEGGEPFFSARDIFLTLGLLTIPIAIYIVVLIPSVTIKFFVWTLSKTVYRVKLKGLKNLPETGGALLIPNHVTWIDGILLLLASERPIRMVVFSGNFKNKILKFTIWLMLQLSFSNSIVVIFIVNDLLSSYLKKLLNTKKFLWNTE